MRTSIKRIAAGLVAVAALTFGLPPNPAMAINPVACDGRTDFLKLYSGGGTWGDAHCFANAGVIAVNIDGVYEFHSGNNKATVNYERDGRYHTLTLEKWSGASFGGARVRAYELRIW